MTMWGKFLRPRELHYVEFERIMIDLEGDARLIWGDIWTPGRYVRPGGLAEYYQFERIVQELEIRRDGELIYRDRFDWDGPWDRGTARWYVGDGPDAATASLFIAGGCPGGEVGGAGGHAAPSLRRAVLPLAEGDTLIRWCGPAPDLVPAIVRAALSLAAGWSPGPSSRPWLIGGHHLNPSHWFSVPPEPA